MADIKNPRVLYLKGALFLLLAILSASLLLLDALSPKRAALLAICVWASCRAYYFAFYVIEHHVDPTFRFAGLIDFLRYLMRHRRDQNEHQKQDDSPRP